jgi:predicted outer membrane repeat protein
MRPDRAGPDRPFTLEGDLEDRSSIDVADSRITFALQGNTLKIPYYRSLALGGAYTNITRAVVVIHGIGRNAHGYYDAVVTAAEDADADDHTIIVVPQFLIENDIVEHGLESNVLFWSESGWVQGDNSASTTNHPRPASISAYSVVDSILTRLAQNNINLRKIVVAGHSAGGQFVNRYSIGNQVEQGLLDDYGITVSYTVANPSSYMYLDQTRWIQGTQYDYVVPDAQTIANCPNFNHYKYGFEAIPVGHYMGRVDDLTLIESFRLRRVMYLLGTADTLTDQLDMGCEANLQGRRRYDRGTIYKNYLAHFYGETSRPCIQTVADVPGVGHSATGMFQSECGQFALFDHGTACGIDLVRGSTVEADGTGDYANVQAAINQLGDGFAVGLMDGTYTGQGNRNIDYLGKKLAVFSVSGLPESCVIDCQSGGQGVKFWTYEEYRALLDGITVKRGRGVNGGGIYCIDASPTIDQCVFADNEATNDGGGAFCSGDANPEISHCAFVDNTAIGGAGIWTYSTGVYSPVVSICTFDNNQATARGGGVYGSSCSTIFTRCIFDANGATIHGGGAYFLNSTPALVNCLFTGNTAGTNGSAYYALSSTVTNSGTTIDKNNAAYPPSGRPDNGSAVYLAEDSHATFANTIVTFNVPGPGVWCDEAQGANLSCCDIFGNAGGDWVGGIAGQLGLNGNIGQDPFYCDSMDGDYHLQDNSPCAPHSPPGCALMGAYPVGCTESLDYADQVAGNCSLTVTDRGIVGFMDATGTQGTGFIYPAGVQNLLFVGSFWIANDAATVENRDYDLEPSKEWDVSRDPDGHIWYSTDNQSDQDIQAFFADEGAPQPLGITVQQESWGFLSAPRENFVVLRYLVRNRSEEPLAGLYAGLFLDLDINSLTYTTNTGAVEEGPGLVFLTDGSTYAGLRLLAGERGGDGDSAQVVHRHLTLIHNPTYVYPNEYIPDADKFAFLSASDSAHILKNAPNPDDYGVLAATGPFDLAPGEMQEFSFALIGGSSLDDLRQSAEAAQASYLYAAGIGDTLPTLRTRIVPGGPNPFLEATTLRFQLATPGDVRLCVFDVSGRLVRRLLDGPRNAGGHALVWDGTDGARRRVGAGVYFYRLEAGPYRESRRLVLIR